MLHAAIAAGVLFVGSTPCGSLPRQFLNIPERAECERITWQITLSETASPATFTVSGTYGMTVPNERGLAHGGTRAELQGTWTLQKGTAWDARAIVYQLTADKEKRRMSFARFGDDLLHPLNERGTLMVGNPGWSYTLSRRASPTRTARGPFARWLEGPAPAGENSAAATAGAAVFEGRTACRDLARVLRIQVEADCFKLKWRLTLSRDQATHARGTYTLEGTPYRDKPRTGTWTIRTAPGDAMVVYQLDPDVAGGFLSMLRADDNILLLLDREGRFLVGDVEFSYTLNRVK